MPDDISIIVAFGHFS